jgi:hypothetical protein
MNPKAKIILFVWLLAFVAQGRAQEFSAEELARRALERRAIEAVIWGMPAANDDAWRRHSCKGFFRRAIIKILNIDTYRLVCILDNE